MQQEIIEIDKQKGILRATTLDERFYIKTIKDVPEGFSDYKFYPSSTWITSYYHKGPQLIKWIASNGYDESEMLKKEAGKKGSKTHYACEDLVSGKIVKIDSEYTNRITDQPEELTPEEYLNVKSFADWAEAVKPEILAIEMTAFNEEHEYAGTIDYIMRIDGQIWIVDLKTSKYIWPSMTLQLSSYSHLDLKGFKVTAKEWKERKLAILQVGYERNKKQKYKFTEVQDKFDVFLSTKAIWKNENENVSPKQVEYPISLQFKMDNAKIIGLKVKKNKITK